MGWKELDQFAGDITTLLAQDVDSSKSIQELAESNGQLALGRKGGIRDEDRRKRD